MLVTHIRYYSFVKLIEVSLSYILTIANFIAIILHTYYKLNAVFTTLSLFRLLIRYFYNL